MANGKVCTGFSMPWVAKYTASSAGVVSYSGGMALARGVSVSLDVNGSEDNYFYADNVKAETDTQAFTDGTMTLTVDGLKATARKFISGTVSTTSVTANSTTVTGDVYDDTQVVPYIGVGFIARYMENGVTTYAPIIIHKVKFNPEGLEAATQEEEIDWQTTELDATIFRDDSSNHAWKTIFADQSTEDAALNVIKAVLTPAA